MIQLRGIEKIFPSNGVKAVNHADFDLKEGEIHALLGENGAGKSTLMHIMAGYMKPGKGRILIDGREFHFASPAKALTAGIGMIRQHPHLVPGFSVWENCMLGSTTHSRPWINRSLLHRKAAALNDRWEFGLPLDSSTETLTASQGQKAAILGLLLRDVRFLVFDEPTAVLAPDETEKLFTVFKRLKEEGKGIVLISHKLEETLKLAGRVTILRRGKIRAVLEAEDLFEGGSVTGRLDGKRLRDLIFGEEAAAADKSAGDKAAADKAGGVKLYPLPTDPARPAEVRPPALELRDFTASVPGLPIIRGINLTLERGKILGIAGVRDSGLETLELAIAGYIPSSGFMGINGTEAVKRNTKTFRRMGGAYLGTRMENAAHPQLPLRDMLIIHAHRRLQTRGFLKRRELERWAGEIMRSARVPRLTKGTAMILSGGQFQRILLMREYAENTPLLVLAEPGRGLDGRYWKRLSLLLRERAEAGSGILIFSADTEALLSVSDQVIVLRDGLFSDTIDPDSADSRERLRKAMVG